jgi:hypothetical protein
MVRFTIMAGRYRMQWLALGVIAVAISSGVPSARAESATPTETFTPAAYVDPAPVRIYRFHVYSTMKSRWKKTVMIDSLVSTSQGGVVEGDRGLLERKIESESAASEWGTVAKVTVKKLLPKGRLQVEIETEEAEAKVKRNGKLPFVPGQKVRLQIDRVMNASG